ncbi:M61 family metallopeptidase [Sphingomonas aracearum]|uniref:M61 family peptidase n=1 Tax=Sphingomonas aracearum TaxID=2283317 RepID=A0A369VYX6_9SPHN|nr:M61 family metallopeptidase [Sphingomonas aracearum]RDE07353.1 M61 family peptidase [Sphingomonas aracearum]
MIGQEDPAEALLIERGDTIDPAQPLPQPPSVPEPRDEPYPGVLRLRVDATDVQRRIFSVREVIPVHEPGPLLLLYPKWLPGFHAPQAPIELFAGLSVHAGEEVLTWKRDPVTVNAFRIDVPGGVREIEARFQFLSPTDPAQGRVLCTEDLLCLPWNTVVLYPAGHYSRQIAVEPVLTLPRGWTLASALELERQDGAEWRFRPLPLDVLVDSPVLAGRHLRRVALDDQVFLNIAGDEPHLLKATPEQIRAHAEMVVQADRLFRSRHFDRFEMLLALSDDLTSNGIEHHRSFEAISLPGYFTNWDNTFPRRDTIPHEYVHSWNGKHRRGADSWSPCFEKPIRNSLMWVYEGQTQYWSRVLAVRSGLWTLEQGLGALAVNAARYDVRPGSRWRPTIDTTRDPIIAARAPLPWPSWQRSEDYYSEGSLMWLEVDTLLRELSGETRSLDDFARAFFGSQDGSWATDTYVFADVVQTLDRIVPHDWQRFFEEQLTETHERAPLSGLERGGYRLVYKDTPNSFQAAMDGLSGQLDLTHSLGLMTGRDGTLSDVLWGGPAFEARLTAGARILSVEDRQFSPDALQQAVRDRRGEDIALTVQRGRSVRSARIAYDRGLRFPHLEAIAGGPARRLDAILQPLGDAARPEIA